MCNGSWESALYVVGLPVDLAYNKMADETTVVVITTVVAGLVALLYFWRSHRTNKKRSETTDKPESRLDLNEARIKRFYHDVQNEQSSVENSSPTAMKLKSEEKERNLDFKFEDKDHKSMRGESQAENQSTKKVFLGRISSMTEPIPRCFDEETGTPVTRPLTTLDEALHWTRGFDSFNVANVHLPEGYQGLGDHPRTLVCHDMKGGYIDDRFVQGCVSRECYRFYHWNLIDIFVYFSHHFITIPPPCWTNAAHTNSVPVLGTIITEWDDGAARCCEFLENEHSVHALADQLVKMADYYNFDGWLVNIENPIQPAQVDNLIEFVKYLTEKMHESRPHSLVIWYDSVTYKGDLTWQNELNQSNSIYFTVCDGIFLNYTWSVHQLGMSAGAAHCYGRPIHDVYVGVDVFGRDCYGGGGYKCNQAFRVIREEKLSVALFAPGWVMETQGAEKFTSNEERFWGLLRKDCFSHPLAISIPFVTSFCRGLGNKVFIDGKVVYTGPWSNFSCQQPQASYHNTFYNMGGKGGIILSEVTHTNCSSYNGGGCLVALGQTSDVAANSTARSVVRLIEADLDLSSGVLVSFTFKLLPAGCFQVGLQLLTDGKPTYLLLCPPTSNETDYSKSGKEASNFSNKLKQRYGISASQVITSSPFMAPIGQDHYVAYAPLTGSDHERVQKASGLDEKEPCLNGWCTRHYLIAGHHLKECKLKEIRGLCVKTSQSNKGLSGQPFMLHLGEIKILDPKVIQQTVPAVENLRATNVHWSKADQQNQISLTLMWECPITDDIEKTIYYDVYYVNESLSDAFIGRAFTESFRVASLSVPSDRHWVEFVVQAVSQSRLKKPLNKSTRIRFTWEL